MDGEERFMFVSVGAPPGLAVVWPLAFGRIFQSTKQTMGGIAAPYDGFICINARRTESAGHLLEKRSLSSISARIRISLKNRGTGLQDNQLRDQQDPIRSGAELLSSGM
jgi:hypothetical protein